MVVQSGTYNPFNGVDVGANSALSCQDVNADCTDFGSCSGHGLCTGYRTCVCFEGFGAPGDFTSLRSMDCSTRICPAGKAWVDIPTAATTAHALAECSHQGICDRSTGKCRCFGSFTGDACQRLKCPSTLAAQGVECSGHGRCVTMNRMAGLVGAFPLSAGANTYAGNEATTTWDQDKVYGCVCDSTWEVGLGSGQTQQSEYFGSDCSLKRCPSGNDPVAAAEGRDVTNCNGKVARGGLGTGNFDNKCHVDCSNRGSCNYEVGECECFTGFFGDSCNRMNGLAGGS